MKKLEDLENERPAKEFAIITKDGKIVTYYKTSLRYFLNEFRNKGGIYWLYEGDE